MIPGPLPAPPTTVYGPCPGCSDWQVDVDEAGLRSSLPVFVVPPRMSFPEVANAYAAYVGRATAAVLDDALLEHAADCPGLAEVLADRARAIEVEAWRLW